MMPQSPPARLGALLLSLALAACAAYEAQHARRPAGAGEPGNTAVEPASREFTELPADAQIARLRGEAEAAKAALARQGRYDCCVEPPCTQCLLDYGECHCREAVRHEGPCCGECTEAWIDGRGAVEGVTAWELLERKKDVLERANRGELEDGDEGGEPPPHHDHHP